MQIIIGSIAIKHYFPDFPREPKDLDIAVSSIKGYRSTTNVEYLENPILCKYSSAKYLEPNFLLTLKMSHLSWNINWEKHMWDVQFLLDKGVKYVPELFDELYEFWNVFHGKNVRSDLKMTKDEFFDNALKEFDHDYLHTLINPVPTYLSMLADGQEVDICPKKFEVASEEDKKNLITEEVCSMAFERFNDKHYRVAYDLMMKKYIISHVPLFVFPYLIKNYRELHKPKYDFIKDIRSKL